ncbi:hypothetical protein ABZ508_02500 [Streptomyces lavendulocolor]|uniref:Uncharacterized protein n=1 Tax=Streptomyces lavendulocolor TaxID=67316 RepID=A0ABV2VY72_9ACTN
MTALCAHCGSGEHVRVVAVREGQDVWACRAHARKLAAPADDTLAALAWYQSERRRTR